MEHTSQVNDPQQDGFVEMTSEQQAQFNAEIITQELDMKELHPFAEIERREHMRNNPVLIPVLTQRIEMPVNQRYILLNICHQNQNPVSSTPGFRILGAFSSMAACRKHVHELESPFNVYVASGGDYIPLCKTVKSQLDPLYIKHRITTGVDANKKSNMEANGSFVERVQTETNTKTGTDMKDPKNKPHVTDPAVETSVAAVGECGDLHTVSRSMEIRNQNFVVVSFIQDSSPDNEPLLRIYGVFDTMAAAQKFISGAILMNNQHSLFICDAYQWKKVHDVNSQNPTFETQSWEHPEVNAIMRAETKKQQLVQLYENVMKGEYQSDESKSDS